MITSDDVYTPSFAAELRRLRLAAGFTLQDLSARTHYSKGHLSKIENGTKAPSLELARKCDAELSAGGMLTALVAAPAAGRHDALAPGPEGATADHVQATAVAVAADLDDSDPESSCDAEDHRTNLNSFETILALMRTLGQTLGPSNILPMLETHVESLIEISGRVNERQRRQVLRIAARFAEYAGWMAQESGSDEAALAWTDRAVEYAAQAGDADLLAYAYVRRALIALYRQDAMTTIRLAKEAQRMRCSPRVMRLAAQREAQGHALAGNELAYEEAIARAAAPLSDEDQPGSRGLILGTSNVPDPVALARGWSLYDLGRDEEASRILGKLWDETPVHSHRARARVGARYAAALVRRRELQEAAEVLEPILHILPRIQSATIEADVRLVARTLSRWHSDPAVSRILPALSEALSARVPQQNRTELERSA